MTASALSLTSTPPVQTQTFDTPKSGIGGTVREFTWTWQDRSITITYEILGYGTPVLLIPALSMVSSRSEMHDLAQYLLRRFKVITFDWPGFGDSDRPGLKYSPQMYRQALKDLLKELGGQPIAIIAPGHTAAYALQVAEDCPELISKLVTVAPTWKSPFANHNLRTLLGGIVRQAVRLPLFGSLLYSLHSTTSFLQLRHSHNAYVKPEHQNREFMAQKQRLTQKSGARHSAIAFVTGGLDPVQDSSDFCKLFQNTTVDMLVIRGEDVPWELEEDMDKIETFSHLETKVLPGSLALHEEYPAELSKAVTPFLTPSLLNVPVTPGRQWVSVSIVGIILFTAGIMAWALHLA